MGLVSVLVTSLAQIENPQVKARRTIKIHQKIIIIIIRREDVWVAR